MHDQFVHDERSQPLIQFKHSEIEIYDIADSLQKIQIFIKRSIQILHHLFHLRREDVPEKFFLRTEIIMDKGLIAAY